MSTEDQAARIAELEARIERLERRHNALFEGMQDAAMAADAVIAATAPMAADPAMGEAFGEGYRKASRPRLRRVK